MVSRMNFFRHAASWITCLGALLLVVNGSLAQEMGIDDAQTLISRMEVRSTSAGEEVWIIGNKPLAHSAFLLSDPYRLVVDIPGATLAMDSPDISGNYRYIQEVTSRRFAEGTREIVRIELVMKSETPYVINSSDLGLQIRFGDLTVGSTHEAEEDAGMESGDWTVPQAAVTGDDLTKATQVYGLQAPKRYKGKPIFLDLKDADILDIFRLIAEVSGFNVVVDPDVSGRITLRMDNVPWDQALEVILKNQGLGREIEGNIMRIAAVKKLREEHTEKMMLEDAKRKALPIESIILYLSYADISDMESAVKTFLSERGTIMKDTRVNALIIRDIRGVLDGITDLVRILDVRTREVTLNAQIVVTAKNFARNLGIQWGGRFFADAQHGNTTGYQFPNNFSVNMTDGSDPDLAKYAVNFPSGSQLMAMTFGNVMDTLRLNLALSASENEGLTKTIARPTITTLNNESATISSGDKIPYFSNSGLEGADVTFQDATTSLDVTPHITNDDWINLEVSVTRDFPGENVGQAGPAIRTNSADTKVLIKDGDTLVLGGLNQSQQSLNNQRIPWLGEIPVLGWLFKNDARTSTFSDLLFFITPRILAEEDQVVRTEAF
ncbi:type IV pilus secretin PilQ [bacterium]|nr:type IV pilus secretin PilQ [candidate division CSSED10-310 bacterium]